MRNKVNENLIETYKGDDRIICDFYKMKRDDILVDIIGVLNPLMIDNRDLMSPTDDQRDFSACAGYSASTLVESIYWKRTGLLRQLDSLQVYQKAKQIDGDVEQDGTYLEASCRAVLELCKEDIEFEFLNDSLIGQFYNDGSYATIENVKNLIHRYDFLQVGFNIDQGWDDCNEENYILQPRGRTRGGHAVNICGYDCDGFYIMNQWSKSWGVKGFAIMPYDLFMKQFLYGTYIYNYKI